MEFQQLQIVAGTVSSVMFVAGTFPMLFKSFMTKDLGSYSLENIALSNLGNLIHWVYIASLPLGPIWFLHGFFTITTALMFIPVVVYFSPTMFTFLVCRLCHTGRIIDQHFIKVSLPSMLFFTWCSPHGSRRLMF